MLTLRACKIHPYEMRTKFGHDVGKLSKKSAELGLEFDDEDLGIFELMSKTDAVIRSRYILTGPYSWPEITALNRVCVGLRRQSAPYWRRRASLFECRFTAWPSSKCPILLFELGLTDMVGPACKPQYHRHCCSLVTHAGIRLYALDWTDR
jgi:hypothetical protein